MLAGVVGSGLVGLGWCLITLLVCCLFVLIVHAKAILTFTRDQIPLC